MQQDIESIDNLIGLLALPPSEFVQTAHCLLLDRRAENAELLTHESAVRAGRGRDQVLADIADSSEFETRKARVLTAGTDAEFIEGLYQRYFRRAPDEGGRLHYMRALARGKSRTGIAIRIGRSREAAMVGSFWFELDRVLADARKDRWPWPLREFGASARHERRRNRALEIVERASLTREARSAEVTQTELAQLLHRVQQHVDAALVREQAGKPNAHEKEAATLDAPALMKVDPKGLGRHARRTLSRMQHLRGAPAPIVGAS